MPAAEVANRVRESLATLRQSDLKDAQIMDVLKLAHQLTDTMQIFFSSLDQSICNEFSYIADYIARTRSEIAHLRPNDIKEQRIPTAGKELEAVVTDTERATESIMQEAENILCAEAEDMDSYKAMVDDAMLRIIEACSFQDLTGQRVSKVVGSLNHVEKRVTRFARVMGVHDASADEDELVEKERANKLHLNGPAVGGPETTQEEIDRMLADDFGGDAGGGNEDPGSGLDQNDIDALFD
ncbi:protein phosphatase CheZ [Woodsholea maritima]|uniref:protein phosphatase CheZ n=1 Tax=Woodsholea maritima TaxID=240237 RepID=UPI00036ADABC|nr:protein phosphatase CheZ [Woodsholea maritima]